MAKNWALVIGINQYEFLQPLKYAKRDAQLMTKFLCDEAGFERVYFFSDDSPDVNGKSTRPIRSNLRRVLLELFKQIAPPRMNAGDNFWFFFSGHGIRHANRDYLMPSDGNPLDIEETAITVNFVTEHLYLCGADNVVLILDACRNRDQKSGEGIGRQTQEMARETGIISIFSCSPNEYSFEIDTLQQGAFTFALLEGLGIKGQCATVERLNQYLSFRVPEIVRQHKNALQTPYIIAEPVNRSHLILVPQYATLAEIATLKNDAYQAEVNKDFELAERLWIRVNAAASGQDMEVIKAIKRISRLTVSTSDILWILNNNQGTQASKSVSDTEFICIHEFSTGLEFKGTPNNWVSEGFTGRWMNTTIDPIPNLVDHSIKNHEFELFHSYSCRKPAIIGRVVGTGESAWSVVALITRSVDDTNRSFNSNRYFICQGSDSLWKVLVWLEYCEKQNGCFPVFNPFDTKKVGQPNGCIVFTKPIITLNHEDLTLHNSNIYPPIVFPAEHSYKLQEINYLAEVISQGLNMPTSWAFNVTVLEKPKSFLVITVADTNSYNRLTKDLTH